MLYPLGKLHHNRGTLFLCLVLYLIKKASCVMYFINDINTTFARHSKAFNNKVAYVLNEHKDRTLRSGKSKKRVRNNKQAIAIALSEAKKDYGN